MSTDNAFEGAEIAAGYATARPPVHPLIINKVSEQLRLTDPIELALDVGCGAGQSTRALLPIARGCIGLDPAREMIQQATTVVSSAQFVIARAEELPVRSRSIALLTAGGSLDYADLDLFFGEAARVLTPDGALAVYDFSFGARGAHSDHLARWYEELLARWPKRDRRRRSVSPEILARGPMRPIAHEYFTVDLVLGFESYVDYVMTETNIANAVRSGTAVAAIRDWCTKTLRPIFSTPQQIEFDCYLACFAPSDSSR